MTHKPGRGRGMTAEEWDHYKWAKKFLQDFHWARRRMRLGVGADVFVPWMKQEAALCPAPAWLLRAIQRVERRERNR